MDYPKYPEMLRDNVLIKVPKEPKTKSGVFIPEELVDLKIASAGVAVKVGPDCKIKVGDFVYWRTGIGNKIEDDYLDSNYFFIVVNEADILGYLRLTKERKKKNV